MMIHPLPQKGLATSMKKLLAIALLVLTWQVVNAQTTLRTLKNVRPSYYEAETKYPHFTGRTPLARFASRTISKWAKKTHSQFIRESKVVLRMPSRPMLPYFYEVRPKVTYCHASRLISVRFSCSEYTGGAHPNSWYAVFNFGLIDGKPRRLTLGDLFRKGSAYRQRISNAILQKLRRDERALYIVSGEVTSLSTPQLNSFSIGYDSLTFLLNPYEVGPYASGSFEVKLSLAELGPDFRKSLIARR